VRGNSIVRQFEVAFVALRRYITAIVGAGDPVQDDSFCIGDSFRFCVGGAGVHLVYTAAIGVVGRRWTASVTLLRAVTTGCRGKNSVFRGACGPEMSSYSATVSLVTLRATYICRITVVY
jgi:hypothetical protein